MGGGEAEEVKAFENISYFAADPRDELSKSTSVAVTYFLL